MANRPTVDFDSRIYGPQRIAAIVETLKLLGVPAAEVLLGSGLDEEALYNPKTSVSYRQVAIIFRNAIQLTPDSSFALKAGALMHLTSYGMYGYGLLSSPNHLEEIEFSVAFSRVMGPVAAPVAFHHGDGLVTYEYDVHLCPDPFDPLYRASLEFAISAHFTLGSFLYNHKDFRFKSVELICPQPAHAAAYKERFGCDAQFNQARNAVTMDERWLERPLLFPDTVTHGVMREICTKEISKAPAATGLAAKVHKLLLEQLPWRFPNVDAMADELAMHPRTLRRRLEAQGTSYREVITNVRRKLAIQYLRETQMSTEEIASRLGYSDASNFRHAFVKWTGRSPQDYRQP